MEVRRDERMNTRAWRYGGDEKWGLRRSVGMEDWWNGRMEEWKNGLIMVWMKDDMEV